MIAVASSARIRRSAAASSTMWFPFPGEDYWNCRRAQPPLTRTTSLSVHCAFFRVLPSMNADAPRDRTWQLTDRSAPDATIDIHGIDFGGSGPIALLSHANGFFASTWTPVARLLTPHYRVVAIDARGHGDSGSPPVPAGYATWGYFVDDLNGVARALLAETGEDRIAYGIGSSFGGIVTAGAAARESDLFERIAMLDPPIHATPDIIRALELDLDAEPAGQQMELVERTRARNPVWPSRDAARSAWRNKPMFATWPSESFDIYVSDGFRDRPDGQVELKCNPQVEAHVFQSTGSFDVLDSIRRVRVPALLARANAGMFPKPLFDALVHLFPDGTLIDLPCGHLMPLEAPELTARTLLEFAGIEPALPTVSW